MNGRPFATCPRLRFNGALAVAFFAVVLPSVAAAADRMVLCEEFTNKW